MVRKQGNDAQVEGKVQSEAAKQPERNLGGRPTKYTDKLAQIIFLRLSEGESLRSICRDEDMPSQATVYNWLKSVDGFLEQYRKAREEQADTLADEIVAIADETPELNPVVDKNTGELIRVELSSAYIAWQKNRIDARKWTASKLRPKAYGDRTTVAGDPESPIEVKNEAMDTLASIIKNLELQRQNQNNG